MTASTIRYDSSSSFASAAITPYLEWLHGRGLLTMNGSIASLPGSEWSLQGRAAGSLRVGPVQSPVSGLLIGEASGTVHSSAYRTSLFRGEARLLAPTGGGGIWAGLAALSGRTSVSLDGGASAWNPGAGIWVARPAYQANASFKPFRFSGSWFPELGADLLLHIGRADVGGFIGWRGAPAASGYAAETWAGGMVTFAWTKWISIVLAGGRYPVELLQGLPGGTYATAGIRVGVSSRAAAARPLPSLYQKRGETGRLSFSVADAERVEIAGEWTHWEKVPLVRSGRRWILDVSLAPGVYRFNLVVDGDRWIVPDGVTSVDDGMGGKTGLLIVPE